MIVLGSGTRTTCPRSSPVLGMHLMNILNHFEASKTEKEKAVEYFVDHKVSFADVGKFLKELRGEV